MDLAGIIVALRAQREGALVALDFDGTLAPIVIDPTTSRPAPGAIEALIALSGHGVRLAVITGRDARTVVALGGLDAVPGLTVHGLYGAESWRDGALHTPDEPSSITALRGRLPAIVDAHTSDANVWIEDKRLSLVVHARRATSPAAAIASVRGPVADLATELGLETHDGRDVLEIRLPGYDKGAVLRRLVDLHDPTIVLFAGDDLGDLPAFEAIRDLRRSGQAAWSLAAASADVPELADAADVLVDGPAGVIAALAAIATV